MFINYEHNSHVYNIEVERKKNQYFVTYNNNLYTVEAHEIKPGYLKIRLGDRIIKCVISENGDNRFVFIDGDVFRVKRIQLTGMKKSSRKEGDLTSPISGRVVRVKTKKGDIVKKGDVLMVIESMKMEYLIRAPYDGRIKRINFRENDQIDMGEITVEIEKKRKKQ